MRDRAVMIVALLAACTKEPPEVTQPATARVDAAPASKGSQVKSYTQQPAVSTVTLTAGVRIRDVWGDLIAIAPDGTSWATATASEVRLFSGDQQRVLVQQRHNAAGSFGFSPDGTILRLGNHDLDATTLALMNQPAIPDLAAWAAAAGLPAPPTLSMPAARKTDDGALLIVSGSGVTRDRREGKQPPESGDVDWLIALDGQTRKPTEVMWHGKGAHDRFAISARHVAAGGGYASLLVFDRKDLTKAIDLGAALLPVIAVAWSADGEVLAAIGAEKKIAVWRTGAWTAPAAIWEVGSDYQRAIALHPTRPLLVVGNLDGHLRIYDLADATLASPPLLLDHDLGGPAHAAAFTPDGTKLFVSIGPMTSEIVQFDLALTP